MKRSLFLWLAVVLVLAAASAVAQSSAQEEAVWKLERTYWESVAALDLETYKSLWHANCRVAVVECDAEPDRPSQGMD